MSKAVKIKRGVNIPLLGEAEKEVAEAPRSEVYAIKPPDFHGMIPRLDVKEGHEVKAGSPLFHDKENPDIKFVSPVSGEVAEVVRGAKRRIMEVRVLADSEVKYEDFDKADPSSLNREEIIRKLLASGCWPFFRQRPYDVIANPEKEPRDIFISGFDSNPLAPDMDMLLDGQMEEVKAGFRALKTLTSGKVYVGIRPGQTTFNDIEGIELNEFKGPHPAGNIGVQIHHTAPINKDEVIWSIHPADLSVVGRLFLEGRFHAPRRIALVGSEVEKPMYFDAFMGQNLQKFLDGKIAQENVRIISGNVLTGTRIEKDGFLGFYHTMISVIPEGDHKKFFLTEGWLSPGPSTFSLNRSYFDWLKPGNKGVRLDTNMNGEQRPFVVTGELEKVFPFDIYPMQLLKSIMVNDIDLMEKLGIYEVSPEDFALCEYACTSKIPLQAVVREGLDTMRKEFA